MCIHIFTCIICTCTSAHTNMHWKRWSRISSNETYNMYIYMYDMYIHMYNIYTHMSTGTDDREFLQMTCPWRWGAKGPWCLTVSFFNVSSTVAVYSMWQVYRMCAILGHWLCFSPRMSTAVYSSYTVHILGPWRGFDSGSVYGSIKHIF